MKMILYKALFDYESADACDLNFKVNDVIEFISQSSPDWYNGKNILTGNNGLFPQNFVAKVDISIVDENNIYVVISGYGALKRGDIVIGKRIENELLVCYLLNDPYEIVKKVPLTALIKIKLSTESLGFTKYVAHSSHDGSALNELTFSIGDTIWMERKLNDVLGEGILHGKKGIFPFNKVYMADISYENIDRKNIWMTLFDYAGTDANDLSIKKGEKLKFIDRIDNNWFLMQNETGKVGMVPCNYVKNISIKAPLVPRRASESDNGTNDVSTDKVDVVLRKNLFIDELKKSQLDNMGEFEDDSGYVIVGNSAIDEIYCSLSDEVDNHFEEGDRITDVSDAKTLTDNEEIMDTIMDQFSKREKRIENEIEVILTDTKSIRNKCSREESNPENIQLMTCNLAFLKEEYKTKLKELEYVKDQKRLYLSGELQTIDESDYESLKFTSIQEKQANKRARVIEEILETEKKFINDLRTTLEAFDRNGLQAKMSDQDFNLLFGDLDSVISVAEQFLSKILSKAEFGIEDIAIGSLFLQSVSAFEEVYKEYCVNYDRKLDLITKKLKNPIFMEFVNEGLTKLSNLGIISCALDMMLVKPLQRFLKYPLFLKTIIENTPSDHPEINDLQAASVAFETLAQKINEKKRFEELRAITFERSEKWHMKTLHAIQKKPKRVIVSISGVTQEEDTEYQLAVTKFKNLKKCISFFIDTVFILRDNLREVLNLYSAITDDLTSILKSQFCSKLNFYLVICKRGETDYSKKYICILDSLVVNPLNKLLELFSGPILLIKKRHSKYIDYLGMKQRFDDKEISRAHIDKMEQLKNQYSAINNTLKEELPILTSKATVILNECLANYLHLTTSSLQSSILSLKNLIEDEQVLSMDEEQRNCRNQQNEILLHLQRDMVTHNQQSRNSIFKGDISSCFVGGNTTNSFVRNCIYHQTEEDVIGLKERFGANNIASVKKDFVPTKPHQIHICAGTIVGILKRCNPQGHSSSWLVEVCPKRTGFVPRSYLSVAPFISRTDSALFKVQFGASGNTLRRSMVAEPSFDLMQFSSNNYSDTTKRASMIEPSSLQMRQDRSLSTSSNIIRVALFNHQSRGQSEISMQKNDNLEILEGHDKSGGSDWSLVRNLRTGAQGYVPTNYLSK